MTKSELIKKVQARFPIFDQGDITLVVKTVFDSMTHALKMGEKIEIRGFGTFTARQRKARLARNPKTGATVELSDRKNPFFKPAKDLRQKVDGKNEL
ncbi:MAG TPA: HU family DNA-binding protein [Smithellaceae bacterium]|jgi:integration host factor subunit beta|nr:HU family DNA-binding protein [Smithellaceae bacterium]HQF83578.1 HU family DNA-binding protein [Smithellaceae bacterium]HQG79562.1 HU family DNA-binding protein [Smithellaceae bacterium]